jgi:hypothetical protein
LLFLLLIGCPTTEPEAPPQEAPAPGDWGGLAGPGGPSVEHAEADLWQPCAYLDGGEDDADHHNFVTMLDGYLFMPWTPEWSGGGVSFFEIDDPCAPVLVGEGTDGDLRESHNVGFSRHGDRTYAALDYHGGVEDGLLIGGVMFWDVTDPTAPFAVSRLALPGYVYPDAYARVTLAVFWQDPYVFVSGADNGFYVVDASDPTEPVLEAQVTLEPNLKVGSVHAIGDLALVSTTEGSRTVLMDISDPTDPKPRAGGDFLVADAAGEPREYYFANMGGRYALFARKEGGGGFAAYDLSDPATPTRVGGFNSPDGNGGYVFRQGDTVFVGESNFAGIYDFSDPTAPTEIGRADLTGDLDTATPIGNIIVLSVDEDAVPNQASTVVPWSGPVDARAPTVELHRPFDGAVQVATTTRIGLSFDEMVEFQSVFEGSFRVHDADGWPVAGTYNTQESLVNFSPTEPLAEDTTYVVSVPAGGIVDLSGNATDVDLTFRFSTGEAVQ